VAKTKPTRTAQCFEVLLPQPGVGFIGRQVVSYDAPIEQIYLHCPLFLNQYKVDSSISLLIASIFFVIASHEDV